MELIDDAFSRGNAKADFAANRWFSSRIRRGRRPKHRANRNQVAKFKQGELLGSRLRKRWAFAPDAKTAEDCRTPKAPPLPRASLRDEGPFWPTKSVGWKAHGYHHKVAPR